jgi:hypothetical protein
MLSFSLSLSLGCKGIISLNNINQLIFVMVKCSVLFEVRTGFLYCTLFRQPSTLKVKHTPAPISTIAQSTPYNLLLILTTVVRPKSLPNCFWKYGSTSAQCMSPYVSSLPDRDKHDYGSSLSVPSSWSSWTDLQIHDIYRRKNADMNFLTVRPLRCVDRIYVFGKMNSDASVISPY